MSHANNEKTTDKATADAPSAFCADFLGDLDTSTDAVVEAAVWKTRVAEWLGNARREARPQRRMRYQRVRPG